MNISHLLAVVVDRPEFEAALPPGWALSHDEPHTGPRRVWNWRNGSAAVALVRELSQGTSVAVFVDAPELEAHIGATLGFVSSAAVLDRLRSARTPLEQVRALVGFGVFAAEPENPEALALVAGLLRDPAPAVRWAALNALICTSWPGQVAVLEAGAAVHPDLAGPAESVRRWARGEEKKAAEAAKQREYEARAARLEALLDDDPAAVVDGLADLAPAEAWRWRSRAWEALDRPTSAWIALYTSIGLGMGRYDDDDPADDDDADDVELPESGLGETSAGVIAVLGDAFDALLARGKAATIRVILDELRGRLRSPVVRFARTLSEAIDFQSPPEAAKLAADFPDVPEAHWIHARSVDALPERAAAHERTADAWLGNVPGKKALTPAERQWVRARLSSHTDKSGATQALQDAVSDYADANAYDDVLRVATRGLALSPESTLFSRFRAVAFSMLKRHDEATVACGEAIAVADAVWGPEPHGDPDPRWLLYFNRSCEHAFAGRRSEALDDLRRAVALNAKAGPKALADAYFQSLWADPELSAVAYGVAAVSPDVLADEIVFAKQNFFHGDRDEAVAVGKRAVAHARVLGDPRALAEALRLAGNAATYTESPARGIVLLNEAVAVSERAWPDQPGERAEAWHLLGAAHHAAGEWDAAEAAYARAEALRREAGGDDAPALAISLADRARLASDRGAPLPDVLALSRQAGDLCTRVATSPDDSTAREALDHATVIWSNAAVGAAQAGHPQEAFVLIGRAVEAFEALLARNGVAQQRVLETTVSVVKWIFAQGIEGLESDVMSLRLRLLLVEEPHPGARDEMLWWAGIRGAARMECASRPPAEVAAAFCDALRGNPPAWFLENPSLAPLVAELPARLPEAGSLVFVAMAMSVAKDAESLDAALDQLQGLAVAHRKES